jgi:ribosomal protein S18 acetylase RimI-like enzyme
VFESRKSDLTPWRDLPAEHVTMRIRQMARRDIPAGMQLKETAHWNQTKADWEFFLSAHSEGCFVSEVDNRVVGTVTTIVYEDRFAWIGMLLVDREFRNCGIGRALLQQAIQHLDSRGIPCMRLDATPQGRPLYKKLGFVVEYEIERWRVKRRGTQTNCGATAPRLGKALQLDREVFGADRSALLRALAQSAPEFVQVLVGPTGVSGYSFGRHGSHSDQLGPWVAHDESGAEQMLDTFLARSARESIVVDCVKSNPWARGALAARGFELARPLTRMRRGENIHPGRPEVVCAILGPEFG